MKTVIYTLADQSGNIRYVGKTIQSLEARKKTHIQASKRSTKRHVCAWIRSVGYNVVIEEIDATLSSEWKWLECYWIAQFKSWNFNLTNSTEGGDDVSSEIQSPESRQKRRNALTGRVRSTDERSAISKGHMGKVIKESSIEKIKKFVYTKQAKEITQYTLAGQRVTTHPSILTACKSLGLSEKSRTNIRRVLTGQYAFAYGFQWSYNNSNSIGIAKPTNIRYKHLKI